MPTRLTAQQREAARLDSTGLSSSEIAARIGIANETLSRWRARRNYRRAVEKLQNEIDKDTLEPEVLPDDKQVVCLQAMKLYATDEESPRVEVVVVRSPVCCEDSNQK